MKVLKQIEIDEQEGFMCEICLCKPDIFWLTYDRLEDDKV